MLKARWPRSVPKAFLKKLGWSTIFPQAEHEVLFVASVTCSQYQIAFKWSVNFWLQLFRIRWDGKYFSGWNFYQEILQIQENWAGRNFIANLHVYSLFITQAKNTVWNQQQLTDGGILANRKSGSNPYCFLSNQRKVQILASLHEICERIVSQ